MGINNIADFAFDATPRAIGYTIDRSAAVVEKTEGVKSLIAFSRSFLKLTALHGYAAAESLVDALKCASEALAAWKWAPRIHDLQKNNPSVIRIISRVSLLVADILTVFKLLDKLGVIANATGRGITAFFKFCVDKKCIEMFGTFGAAFELFDALGQVSTDGMNWERGLTIAGSLSRVIVYGIGESNVYWIAALAAIAGMIGPSTHLIRVFRAPS